MKSIYDQSGRGKQVLAAFLAVAGTHALGGTGEGLKPLKEAIEADDAHAVRVVMSKDPDKLKMPFDDAGRSALHFAADRNAVGVARAIVEAGGDFYLRDVNGQLALDLPPGQAMNDTRAYLREINKSRNAFLSAVHQQQIDRVKEALNQDRGLANARDIGDGWSAVMTACHFGNEELLAVLLAAGASTRAVDFNTGQDAVYVAAEKGHAGCLKQLADAGADLTTTWTVAYGRLPMRMNALHLSAWKGHDDVVRLLIERKVDVNQRAASYAVFSPLHFAATDGHTEIVKRLLAAGADRTARDGRRGITALEMAEAGKHDAAAAALRGP